MHDPPPARERYRCSQDSDTRESNAPDARTPVIPVRKGGVVVGSNSKSTDRPGDVLDPLLAEVFKVQL